MKEWHQTKYGEAPFRIVKLYDFAFTCAKTPEETAYAQYNLLLIDDVLQVHLEHKTCRGKLVALPQFEFAKEMKKLGFECKVSEETTLPYEQLLSANNLF